ncbi:MAG: hypothetical protein JJU34_11520 [Lunatimonas sp.]|uniref:hypothetical protein n=1 Tax=Lunatimonas sp. TaxID=2060141 RepID=UPI00263A473A|nr:hypothetical protein [Lunatimonas sp.]MCC5937900.1 hypothetical protein [Lunatimonas sp.]
MRNQLFLISILVCMAYTPASLAQLTEEIRTAAQIYAYAQVNADLDMLLDMTYPELVEKAGGPQEMKDMLSALRESETQRGRFLREITVKDPIEAVQVASEIHAIVPIVTTLTVPEGLLTIESSLIAVGTERRGNWYFIETNALDQRNVQKVLPTWDNSLALPPKRPGVFKDTNRMLE